MSEPRIDLAPFCSHDPFRPYLHRPWSRNGNTYATNGHILVRVPSRDGDEPAGKNSPDAEVVFRATDQDEPPQRLPLYELPARAGDKDCPQCEGRGHAHDCPDCECDCDGCDGSGKIGMEDISVDFCGSILNAKYVRMLQKLPGIMLAKNHKAKDGPLYFKFDGGDGALMPMRSETATHIKATP